MASVTLQTRGKRGEGLQRCPSSVYCWHSVNVAQHAVCLGHCQWWGLFLTHLTDGVAEASVGAGEGQGPEPRTSGHRTPDPQPQELEACGGASVLSPQHPHAHLGIQSHSLNRGQHHPVVGDPGSQDPMVLWVSAARDRAWTVHSEWDPPQGLSQLCSQPQTYSAGLCIVPSDTHGRMVPLLRPHVARPRLPL